MAPPFARAVDTRRRGLYSVVVGRAAAVEPVESPLMIPLRQATAFAAAILAAGAGCGPAALTRDDTVQALMAQNRQLQDDLLAAEDRIADLKAAGATPSPRPERAEDPFRALAVRFGKHTRVLEADDAPSADRLTVIIEPLDAEGETVKRAGRLRLEALVVAPAGDEPRPYHTWTFPQADLAQTWIGSLGIRGYVLNLRWPRGRPPEGEALLLRARFTTLRGEALTAETRLPLAEARY